MAGLELADEPGAVGAGDHADLRQPPRHGFRRRADERGQGGDAVGQRRIGGVDRRAAPMDRRRLLDRRVEVVAEGGAERRLVALLDGEEIDHRRPHLLVLDMQQARERLRLGLETVGVALGLAERLARHVERLPGRRLGRLGAHRLGFGGGDRRLCRGRGLREPVEIDGAGGVGHERVELGR